jgi:anti-anti-sigma factor
MGTTRTSDSILKAGRTDQGYCLKILGRGTMHESPAVDAFIASAMDGGADSVILDLNQCTYLDSTFLGCLVDLHRRYSRQKPPRLLIAADDSKVKLLLHPTRIDAILKIVANASACLGDCIPLPIEASHDKTAFSRHVMECHRHLAEIEGPNQAKFAMIADQMAKELMSAPAR